MPLSREAALAQGLRAAFGDDPPARLGVAVSGGGDSMALLHLLADWAAEGGPALAVVTVDHGLRPAAAAEAAMVARVAAGLGLPHQVLRWQGWDGRGNLMDAARRARMALIAEWAAGQGVGVVALGHTADDQAETLLMRLARGSGVDGLAAMAPARRQNGVIWLRPLLGATRADLRSYLSARGGRWAEDPTNDDPAFDRVRMRQALALLAPLGVTRDRLVETAARMAMARQALEETTLRAARACAAIEAGDVVFRRAPLLDQPMEIQLRLLAHAIRWIAGADYRPRLRALSDLRDEVMAGRRRVLAGCLLTPARGLIRVGREPQAAARAVAAPGTVWDGRFVLDGPDSAGTEVRMLGDGGLALCPRWRDTGLPHSAALASPAAWRGGDLVAAPLAGHARGWLARPARDPAQFFLSVLSH